ncbi:transcriptional regulator, RpiR family [Paracoccus thiocyanatus]|uniref:Transcriptional regulator, RpiR family n=1 Tax=Paracoccus thiocyanatus TaxID=34006 RepID=A0A1N6VYC4_9RHOB|nr:MurR/RpiR family transcriptional regulator [Paracoccus thiocyanatus]SIQ82881.1 transcriptional regulator, RpiR family [Paracoccus thiocyanatus]
MTQPTLGRTTLAAIHNKSATLPAAQARVARIFLERPEEAIRLSVAGLAHAAQSGEASVVRFCRTMGFDNLRDLRVALAADVVYRRGDASCAPASHVDQLCTALRGTSDGLEAATLYRVARAMRDAPHIDIFGSGVSGMGADLFAYRFSRIGLLARAFRDDITANEIAASRKRGSVAMILSETGLTLRTGTFLAHSRDAGAITVAVCGQGGAEALAPLCDEIITTAPLVPSPQRGELAPLIGKLMVSDLLAAAVVGLGQGAGQGKKRTRGQA